MSKDTSNAGSTYSDSRAKNEETKNRFSSVSNENIKEIISNVLDDFGKFLDDKKDDIYETTSKYTHKYKNKIKENPILTVAGALALGLILGVVIRR